jgi:predicted dehydrogenase
MKKLRIGIVGTGFIAPFHFKGFQACPEAEVVGMCTHSNQEKLKSMCAEWGIKAFPSFEALASDPAVDALVIGSINTDHFEQIMRCQELRKPVLIEKPVVTDLALLDLIRASVAKTGVAVMPAHNFAYRGAVLAAKAVLQTGKLGRIIFSSFASNHTISEEHSKGWRSKLSLGAGGALMDSGHHQVYQSLFLAGRPVALHGFKSRLVLTQMEGEDVGHVQVQYADGSVGSILQTWTNNNGGPVDGIRIVGTEGSLHITDALYVNKEKVNSDVEYPDSFVGQAKAFVAHVLHGAPLASNLDDAHDTLRLIQLAYKSAEQGTVERF